MRFSRLFTVSSAADFEARQAQQTGCKELVDRVEQSIFLLKGELPDLFRVN
jgi:hypothetical protein